MLQKNIEEARAKVLDGRNKNIQRQILQREADSTRTLYDGLLQQYKDLGVAGATGANNVAVIDRAQRPGAPYKPDLQKNLLIWFVLGLLGAAAAVAGREILDDTFKSPEEIEDQLGLAVLGLIPKAKEDIFESSAQFAGVGDLRSLSILAYGFAVFYVQRLAKIFGGNQPEPGRRQIDDFGCACDQFRAAWDEGAAD